jgi:hypothetical protein
MCVLISFGFGFLLFIAVETINSYSGLSLQLKCSGESMRRTSVAAVLIATLIS